MVFLQKLLNPAIHVIQLYSLCLLFLTLRTTQSFLTTSNAFHFQKTSATSPFITYASSSSSEVVTGSTSETLEIILFGIGDLRTIDHGGLSKALNSSNKILPLFILDPKDTIPNIPMINTHLIDNAKILHANLDSLSKNLKKKFDLDLHICTGTNNSMGIMECLHNVVGSIMKEGQGDFGLQNIIVHSCDLGDVDNQNLGYGPFGHLMKYGNQGKTSPFRVTIDGNEVIVDFQSWNCFLREKAWDNLSSKVNDFPSFFPDYEKKYDIKKDNNYFDTIHKSTVSETYTVPTDKSEIKCQRIIIPSMKHALPSIDEIKDIMCSALDIEDFQEVELGSNTGLFATHWGGLDIPSTFDEDSILKVINIFLGQDSLCNGIEGDEALAATLKWWSQNHKECKLKRNPKSLEHASISWLMTGGEDSLNSLGTVKTKSLIEGELLTRYLSAPLLFGTVSPRYLWRKADKIRREKQSPFDIFAPNLPSVRKLRKVTEFVQSLTESREWHKLFAAKNLRMEDKQPSKGIRYDYLRWHGFLCRYAFANINESLIDRENKEGVVLVHGFGASGSQWEKAITELGLSLSGHRSVEALAPDLIGFGQSEKPSLSYTQYLWEGYTADCVKEIGLAKRGWSSFTIGGNSIGGYTAMGAAADDDSAAESTENVSSLGSSGTKKCKGLVLMNSAGRILSNDEVNESGNTVAELTALDMLGISRYIY